MWYHIIVLLKAIFAFGIFVFQGVENLDCSSLGYAYVKSSRWLLPFTKNLSSGGGYGNMDCV